MSNILNWTSTSTLLTPIRHKGVLRGLRFLSGGTFMASPEFTEGQSREKKIENFSFREDETREGHLSRLPSRYCLPPNSPFCKEGIVNVCFLQSFAS